MSSGGTIPYRLPEVNFQLSNPEKSISKNVIMSILKSLGLCIPPIRRLYDARNELAAALQVERGRAQAARSSGSVQGSPFFHYFSVFDPAGLIMRYAAPNLVGRPGLTTNFLGVLTDPKVYPASLMPLIGKVESAPIPANWHADMAEWGAALRAVDLAVGRCTIVELGCGWGCWLNNMGVAAKRRGLDVRLVGIEGDPDHASFAKETTALNGFSEKQVSIHHGVAAANSGVALFPRQEQGGASWGLEPIFGATEEQRVAAVAAGTHDELPMVALDELIASLNRVDLLHVDIQGGEADLIAGSLPALGVKVAYILVGTHSRQIEGRIMESLFNAGWILEIERPAILVSGSSGPTVSVDGVQGWRNPRLLPTD
jgi:FkbM family methyltransferase